MKIIISEKKKKWRKKKKKKRLAAASAAWWRRQSEMAINIMAAGLKAEWYVAWLHRRLIAAAWHQWRWQQRMKNQRNGSYGEMRSGGMALAGSRSQCGSNQRHPAYVSASKRKMKAYEEKKRKTNGVKSAMRRQQKP
jgi:hypothetical protein